ncbi:MAG: hypothetical protein KAT27_04025 [Desulfobacterales bacterium]|nr:hypothetical protein [Desulfobacterales bacterium]
MPRPSRLKSRSHKLAKMMIKPKYSVFALSDPCPPLPHMAVLKLPGERGAGRRVRILSGK